MSFTKPIIISLFCQAVWTQTRSTSKTLLKSNTRENSLWYIYFVRVFIIHVVLVFYVYSLKILQRADRYDDLFIADICKLQVECPKHSFCDTTYIGSSSPPGSYQCVCDDGYSSSSKRPGNLVASGEKCTENPPSGKSTCKIRGILPYL